MGFLIKFLAGREQVDVLELLVLGHLGGRLGDSLEAFVLFLPVGQVWIPVVLVGDGGKKNDDGGGLPVVLLGLGLVDPVGELARVFPGLVVPSFVGAEEGEDHVGLGDLQVCVRINETAVSRAVVNLVPAEAMIAEGQFLLGHRELGVGLEPTVVLHALGQSVTEENDSLAVLDFQCKG